MPYIGKKPADIIATAVDTTTGTFSGDIDVDGTTPLDGVDVDGAVNFAADVTFADGADIITASAGTSNFRAGVNAGNSITSGGNYNVTIGDEAGTAISTGDSNVFVGYQSGDATTISSSNTAIGGSSLGTNIVSSKNVAVGSATLFAHNLGSAGDGYNTAVGFYAGVAVTTGTSNTLIGANAGDGIVTGTRNTALGFNALGGAVDDGNYNTCIGSDAGLLTTGSQNCFVGGYDPSTGGSGEAMTTGSKNTIIGSFNGNQGGLDIRTSDNNIVLSDGDGNPRAIYQLFTGAYFWGFNLSDADAPNVYSYTSGGGQSMRDDGLLGVARSGGNAANFNRTTNDGDVVLISQNGTVEGVITVSGTTVSYNGGHLARYSQLTDNSRDNTIVKGTVMTNLDQMAEWTTDGVTEDNEQLNCMAVSSVDGDANVAGVFVNWDNDDEVYTGDMNIAMTGDMVIRIAQGTTVARGDLLMSAGDGTAKTQGDDIVRSKTIAKVTSTNVSHTYDDGTYLVPCVLMAC
jgi:hypothetical protein